MYSIIIVDDDKPVLEFLTASIQWEKHGFRLVGAYQDPLEALEAAKLNKTEALLTDIGMPGINGLELIQRLREDQPHLKVAILSCHDEFHYAQAAVKLSVSEYILKETMNVHYITEVLLRLKEQLDTETELHSKSRRLEREIELNRGSSRRHFIRSFVNEPLLDTEEWNKKAERFGIRLKQCAVLPIFGYANRLKETTDKMQSKDLVDYTIENIIEELLIDQKEIAFFTYDCGQVVLLFPHYSQLHVNNNQKVEETMRRIQNCLLQYAKIPFSFLTGTAVNEVRLLKNQLKRMVDARNACFYLPESSVIKLDHVREGFGDGNQLLAQYMPVLEEFRQLIYEGQSDMVEAFVSKWINFIQYHRFRPIEVKEWFLKMILDVRMRLKSIQHYHSNFSAELLHHDVHELASVWELELWLRNYLRQAIDWAGQIYSESRNREILECQRFVHNRLEHKISLEEAAAHLHLHPSYLSRLFKRETGENFIEFVTRLKMEKAKELLELTNMTVEEIVDKLDYENKNYFGKLFKTHTGMTPSAFRLQAKAITKQ